MGSNAHNLQDIHAATRESQCSLTSHPNAMRRICTAIRIQPTTGTMRRRTGQLRIAWRLI